ncbi:MAG: TolC family protein [Bacteroidetes bacterium]|nr:TolC family protein [Bacteroidota bacterium]
MKRIYFMLLGLISMQGARTQGPEQVLEFERYLDYVVQHHPYGLAIDQISEQAKGSLLGARGGFDPILESRYDQKEFDQKNYWQWLETKVKVPTWFGISGYAAYDWVQGAYVDPSRTLPSNGLPALGLEASLLRGLVIDERRAALRQAQQGLLAAEQERVEAWNELMLKAIKAYWDWVFAWRNVQVFDTSVQVAERQFQGVRAAYVLGENPAIDTLDAFVLFQERQTGQIAAAQELIKARLSLSTFLWRDRQTPLELDSAVRPDEIRFDQLPGLPSLDSLSRILPATDDASPLLQRQRFEIAELQVQRRLASWNQLPMLNARWNALYQENQPAWFTNNYKIGLDFYMPLLLRKERGKRQEVEAKLTKAQMDYQFQRLGVRNQLLTLYNEWNNLGRQLALLSTMTDQLDALFRAEQRRFELGESSIFLINQRQQKYIEYKIKETDVRRKLHQKQAEFKALLGELMK